MGSPSVRSIYTEAILLKAARRYAEPLMRMSEAERKELQRHCFLPEPSFEPHLLAHDRQLAEADGAIHRATTASAN